MKRPAVAAILATIYLVLYCITLQFEYLRPIGMYMFLFSPLIVLWLVYTVIRHGRYTGRELDEQEEFGYQDREKDSLGMF